MTIDTADYTAYLKENEALLREMEARHSAVFSYLLDSLVVNNYIVTMFAGVADVPQDLDHYRVIFEESVGYFHEAFESYKTIYQNAFAHDPVRITPYEGVIVHMLYLDDISDCLREKNLMTAKRKDVLARLSEELDALLREQKGIPDDLSEHFTFLVSPLLPAGFQTTGEIIAQVADEVDD